VLLVGLGDSVTAGYGASPAHGYFDRLVGNPSDEFDDMKGVCLGTVFPNLKARNLSISGSTSLEHLDIQISRMEKAAPDTLGLVVMTTGGNDLIHDYGRSPPCEGAMYGATLDQAKPWVERFEKRLDAMIGRITAAFPGGCHLFLADIYDPTDGVGDIENAGLPAWRDGKALLDAYNAVIRRAAQKHPQVHVVPMHDAFLGHGIHSAQFWRKHYRREDPHYWYFTNLEDPNDRGYDAIRRLFLIEIAKVLAPAK
jgi:lysophospholipase L1-like esterase